MKLDAIDRLMRRTHLFSALDDRQFVEVRRSMRLLTLVEGERLFDFGQKAERFYMVYTGQVKLFRVSPDGNEKVIEIARPGKLFAEAVMFMERRHYPVSTAALEPSQVCSFDNRTFQELLFQSTDLCLALLADMSMRLHARLNEIDHLTLQNATYRVVHYLCELLPESDHHETVIDLTTPKNVIASQVSIKPETFSRILHNLVKDGIVTIQGRQVLVHDLERLRRFGR